MKIVADAAVPFLNGVFEPWAEVVYLKGSEIGPEDVRDADALITRTRTRCDAALLAGSKVRIISSATIGTDHVDLPWCDAHGIVVRNAAGCNAGGVMEYIICAIFAVASRQAISLKDKTLGIVGVGHVGQRVDSMARRLGFKTLLCDPPRAKAEGSFGFCSLDQLLAESDIVTLHVPLDKTTRRMASTSFFRKMKPGAFFLNSARGEVVDEAALLKALPKLGPVVIDTWNNEPNINIKLLEAVDIATPHIAGYSYQGKQNGTAAAVRAIAHYFGISELYEFYPPTEFPENEAVKLDFRGMNQGEIASVLSYNYPIYTDDFLFRLNPSSFEQLRADYHFRPEFYCD
ncbi:MAG: 4-phosphoerythronate dehydrogenase [Bacteroidales bacterium]|nr:4-phosphoerythronate dehydrogenase [Bacteroidales bacterium]